MEFSQFDQSILSPDLKAVAAHWNAARGDKLMPSWNDLQPAAMAKQLPKVWSYVYDPEHDEFVGRLGGEAIARIFGKAIKGARLSELVPIIGRERMAARLKRVMELPALVSGSGPLFTQIDRYGVGERIIMPLASDGMHAESVLGATEYSVKGMIPSEISALEELEQWFPLSQ
jgi:hypothetical protein